MTLHKVLIAHRLTFLATIGLSANDHDVIEHLLDQLVALDEIAAGTHRTLSRSFQMRNAIGAVKMMLAFDARFRLVDESKTKWARI